MIAKKSRPHGIAEYIAAAPKAAQKKLREMRALIRKAAPGAKEGMKWGMPSYSYKRILVLFAGHKNHVGFYPTTSAMRAFKKELSKFKTLRGTVQFPHEKPLPQALIRKITAFRVRELVDKDGKWRS